MTEWRFGRGWRVDELGPRLHALASLAHNFDTPEHEMTTQNGWNNYYLESVVARDEPGDHTKFERLTRAVSNYEFSEPRIVRAHFDRASQLLGRRMLLDIQALRLHYLCPVMVTAVRDDETDEGKVFGYRYETLEGHIETGAEWFLLKKTGSGDIHFRIDALWRHGQFPNWWSRLGFRLLAKRYQREWHRRAQRRMIAFGHNTTTNNLRGSLI